MDYLREREYRERESRGAMMDHLRDFRERDRDLDYRRYNDVDESGSGSGYGYGRRALGPSSSSYGGRERDFDHLPLLRSRSPRGRSPPLPPLGSSFRGPPPREYNYDYDYDYAPAGPRRRSASPPSTAYRDPPYHGPPPPPHSSTRSLPSRIGPGTLASRLTDSSPGMIGNNGGYDSPPLVGGQGPQPQSQPLHPIPKNPNQNPNPRFPPPRPNLTGGYDLPPPSSSQGAPPRFMPEHPQPYRGAAPLRPAAARSPNVPITKVLPGVPTGPSGKKNNLLTSAARKLDESKMPTTTTMVKGAVILPGGRGILRSASTGDGPVLKRCAVFVSFGKLVSVGHSR